MKISKFRDLRVDEYEQILRLQLKADETKNKKRFHHNYNDKFFSYICLSFFFSSMFLFCDKFMFEEKKVPTE